MLDRSLSAIIARWVEDLSLCGLVRQNRKLAPQEVADVRSEYTDPPWAYW